MGSRWASWTGKHPRNPNPSQGPLVRSYSRRLLLLWQGGCSEHVPVGLGCPEAPQVP